MSGEGEGGKVAICASIDVGVPPGMSPCGNEAVGSGAAVGTQAVQANTTNRKIGRR